MSMWHPYSVEQYVRAQQAEHLRWAERDRLVRLARRAPPGHQTPSSLRRRVLHWIGGQLIAWGQRLQLADSARASGASGALGPLARRAGAAPRSGEALRVNLLLEDWLEDWPVGP
jgi:hypothetical protein